LTGEQQQQQQQTSGKKKQKQEAGKQAAQPVSSPSGVPAPIGSIDTPDALTVTPQSSQPPAHQSGSKKGSAGRSKPAAQSQQQQQTAVSAAYNPYRDGQYMGFDPHQQQQIYQQQMAMLQQSPMSPGQQQQIIAASHTPGLGFGYVTAVPVHQLGMSPQTQYAMQTQQHAPQQSSLYNPSQPYTSSFQPHHPAVMYSPYSPN
jgi:hypothetical protein